MWDEYVEAQVHGPVRWGADVVALVLDPSFRGIWVEEAAGRLGCAEVGVLGWGRVQSGWVSQAARARSRSMSRPRAGRAR